MRFELTSVDGSTEHPVQDNITYNSNNTSNNNDTNNSSSAEKMLDFSDSAPLFDYDSSHVSVANSETVSLFDRHERQSLGPERQGSVGGRLSMLGEPRGEERRMSGSVGYGHRSAEGAKESSLADMPSPPPLTRRMGSMVSF